MNETPSDDLYVSEFMLFLPARADCEFEAVMASDEFLENVEGSSDLQPNYEDEFENY
jgi:hypothetical protein